MILRFYLIILNFLFFFFLCDGKENPYKSIVTGTIKNYNPKKAFSLVYSHLGFERILNYPEIDQYGQFKVELEIYLPTEVWIVYNNNFPIIISPKDSIHIEFDGNLTDLNLLRNSTKFTGKSKFSNDQFSEMNLFDWNNITLYPRLELANKNLKPQAFKLFADSVANEEKIAQKIFEDKYKSSDIPKALVERFFRSKYNHLIAYYAYDYKILNSLSLFDTTFTLPNNYYQFVEENLPIKLEELVSTNDFNTFIRLTTLNLDQKLKTFRKPTDNWSIDPFGNFGTFNDFKNEVRLNQYIEHIKDPLIREILIANYLSKILESQKLTDFEELIVFRDQYVKSDFLKIPLEKHYLRVKMNVESPVQNSKIVFNEFGESSVKNIMEEIRLVNKGKVIYIDVWGTWCGPCIGSFPYSRVLQHNLKDKAVSFAYICLGTDEKIYKSLVNEYQLEGQHFFLNSTQAKDIQKVLNITAVPFYLIIDQNGVISRSGNHLNPQNVENIIIGEIKN